MWPNPQETADLFTYTEGILNESFRFLCSVKNHKPDETQTLHD